MPRAKHGKYDEERGLPYNTGQPDGSGLYVWLCREVVLRIEHGGDLVNACHAHGDKRYVWLVEQISAMQAPEAAELVAEFEEKRKYLNALQRQRLRHIELKNRQSQLEERPDDPWLPKKIKALEREIAKAEERWSFSDREKQ